MKIERVRPGPGQESVWDYPRPPRRGAMRPARPGRRRRHHARRHPSRAAGAGDQPSARLLPAARGHPHGAPASRPPAARCANGRAGATYFDVRGGRRTPRRERPGAIPIPRRPSRRSAAIVAFYAGRDGRVHRRRRARDAPARRLLRRLDHRRRGRPVQGRARQLGLVAFRMIEVEGLERRYGRALAVAGVSFRVAPGRAPRPRGRLGVGQDHHPEDDQPSRRAGRAGACSSRGEDMASLEPHALRRSIGYVFQGVGLFPHMTVAENVAVPLRLLGWRRERIPARVAELLELVELDAGARAPAARRALGRPAAAGRGGPRARRLAALMLLDEPFGALDPLTRDRLQRSFDALRDARPHHGHRHPRHGRGHPARRPHRGDARRPARADGTPADLLGPPATTSRALLSTRPGARPRLWTRCSGLGDGSAVTEQLALLPGYLDGPPPAHPRRARRSAFASACPRRSGEPRAPGSRGPSSGSPA